MSRERELLEKWVSQFGNLRHDFNLLTETKELLAQPEQEPVAWIIETEIEGKLSEWVCTDKKHYMDASDGKDPIPLYTAPQKREPLSDEEVGDLLMGGFSTHLMDLARMVEKAHGIGGAPLSNEQKRLEAIAIKQREAHGIGGG